MIGFRAIFPAILACLLGPAGWAQLAPSADAPPPASTAPALPDEPPIAILKTNVDLVNVFFTVKDKAGNLVPHLTQNDCSVEEDKQPQTLKNFVAETSQALTLGVLLDTSGSQQKVLPLEQDIGAQFLKRVLRAKDQAFLVSFDINVDLLQDYTSSAGRLARALSKAEINTGTNSNAVPTPGQPRGTLLYDAVSLASREMLGRETGRKAMILLTDGEDQGSHAKIADAVEASLKADVIVYVILIADRGFYSEFGYTGYSAMKKLTEETGGRLIDVGNNGKKLEAAFQQIEDELRTQYAASYTPTNNKQDGSFRRLSVTCKGDGMKVLSRKGYYAAAP